MSQGLVGIFGKTVSGVRSGFNYAARKTQPARDALDRTLVGAPPVISWPYKKFRHAYEQSTGSTKALFFGGAVLGGFALVEMGADIVNVSPEASIKLWLAAKAMDVAAIGKFFVYDVHKPRVDPQITNPMKITAQCLKLSFEDVSHKTKELWQNSSPITKVGGGATALWTVFTVASYFSEAGVDFKYVLLNAAGIISTVVSYNFDQKFGGHDHDEELPKRQL
ncbi:MAG: hypothetical protein KDJ35_07050 [Alphaproteobacteria bacterium]|nr:hypothetical protein [Alphaproteobacteria bacterium]